MDPPRRHGLLLEPFVELFSGLLATVLPVSCAGCSRYDTRLCPLCVAALALPPEPLGPVATTVVLCPPTFAALPYAGVLRAALLAWKDRGRLDLRQSLAPLLSFSALSALSSVPSAPTLLVPVPSTRRAVRERGQDVVATLARTSARQLEAAGAPVMVAPVLRSVRAVRDQAGLSAHERAQNLQGALGVARGARVAGRWCLLVDDVVTTGASLAEARRALEAAGAQVSAAATIAATARPALPEPALAGPAVAHE